jgi:transposase InsO family protein
LRYAFVAAHGGGYSSVLMCRVLSVSRSGYYAWLVRSESARSVDNRRMLAKIRAIHARSRKTYGSPRVYKKLRADGETCGEGRVARLMAANGIRAKQKRKFRVTTDSKHNLPVAQNLLSRQFDVAEPNRVWACDITYIPTGEGWLYLSAVMDLYSRKIVGWSMSDRLERPLVIDALIMAQRRRKPAEGMLHHSDRGSQYASHEYRMDLRMYGMTPSMSRKGDCWDNAPVESFFGTLKTELVHHRKYRTREEARRDIFEYIEVFYNRERLHSSLGYLSPTDFEAAALANAA